uniref:Ubiquitin-like protease family profile domain-containing protein n=1 Tax=Glossina brevipalpis TaxID=37001 RepID=A0A1A9W680_9MUSC
MAFLNTIDIKYVSRANAHFSNVLLLAFELGLFSTRSFMVRKDLVVIFSNFVDGGAGVKSRLHPAALMMYIENTALDDNLHHILNDRVPSSRSPNSTETEAESALINHVRVRPSDPALNGAPQSPKANNKCDQVLDSQKEATQLPANQFNACKAAVELEKIVQVDSDAEEEEEYELVQVIDSEPTIQASVEEEEQIIKENNEIERTIEPGAGEEVDCSHFFIELADNTITDSDVVVEKENSQEPQDETEEEEFEYILTRVPKRRTGGLSQFEKEQHQEQQLLDCRLRNLSLVGTEVKLRKADRSPPTAITKERFNIRLLNPEVRSLRKKADIESPQYFLQPGQNGVFQVNHYNNFNEYEDDRHCSDIEAFEEVSNYNPGQPNNCSRRPDTSSMAFDIINKLRQLLNFNTSSKHQSSTQETKRKRRSENWSGETPGPHQIKYRKVENRFPKFISQTQEDDDFRFLPPSKYDNKLLLNRSISAVKSKRNILEMSNGRSLTSIEKPPLRKSIFSAPEVAQQLVKNTTYADVEFSDDDEDAIVVKDFDEKPSCSTANRSVPKMYNIPINHRTEDRLKFQAKPASATPYDWRTEKFWVPKLVPANHMSYADVCRQQTRSNMTGRRATGSSICSSEASTSSSVRVLNGLNHFPTNPWPSSYRSILTQERENEEREKYKQLLEQVMPSMYDMGPSEAKSNSQTDARRKRSAMLVAAANSSARSSPSANRRSLLAVPPMIFGRPQLSSTINLDDDDDEDEVTLTGVSNNRASVSNKIKAKVPTVIVDDDDVSDIIDLGNDYRHTLLARGKVKQQDKPTYLDLCKGYKEKPKKTDLPFVEPVNTLREHLNASPQFKDNWLENFRSKWSLRRKSRLTEVQETNNMVEKLAAERRAAEAEIQERLRTFQIVDPELLVIDDFEEPVVEEELIELTQEHHTRINAAICGPPDQVLVSKFNLNITRRDIHTLCGHSWLNDEVINFYMNLLTDRGEKKNRNGLPTVYAMNTFFIPRLMQAGYSGVKRWTRKVDIFNKDILPIPVHVGGVHWCMAIIHLKNRSIKYYDSMGTPNPNVLKALEQYLKDESMDKRKQPFDTSQFIVESVLDVPRQMNGSDCGVFSCMFAEYVTRDKDITFSQQNMEYFRQKMILEIVQGELLQ